jgi:hypothetical protein
MRTSCTLLRVVSLVVLHAIFTEAAIGATLADNVRVEAHVYLQRAAGSLRDQNLAVQRRILIDSHQATAMVTINTRTPPES